MRRTLIAALAAALLASCSSGGSPQPNSSPSGTTGPSIAEHESGPQSPIAFGLFVPPGATQLGPLVRYRTERVIRAFQPELRAALIQQAITDARRDARRNDAGVPLETPPTPPAIAAPRDDTFALLDDVPVPDVTISFMRVDGDPNYVVRAMAAEIADVLPDDAISPNDMRSYCTFGTVGVQRCHLSERGRTRTGAELGITMTVDLGDPVKGVALPTSEKQPVMTVAVTYLGEPKLDVPEDPEVDIEGDITKLSEAPRWPNLTSSGDANAPIFGDWTIPSRATVMLRGNAPRFAALVVRTGKDADAIAESFAASAGGEVQRDVAEELNEIRTTYTSTAPDGSQLIGSFVASARGNYVLLLRMPSNGWR